MSGTQCGAAAQNIFEVFPMRIKEGVVVCISFRYQQDRTELVFVLTHVDGDEILERLAHLKTLNIEMTRV